jgi:lysophospholipase L1-like esterase
MEATEHSRRGSAILRYLGFLGVQLVIVLTLLECGLRLARPRSAALRALLYLPRATSTYENVDSLEELLRETPLGFTPYRRWKGFVLNSRSFRTREYPAARPPGAYRVVALGDSFTVGAGRYADAWPARLEGKLGRRLRREVEVFALGVPGVGPRFALRLWELEHDLLRPDLVVLGFFVGNDFTDDRTAVLGESAFTPLLRASYTARLARNLARAWPHRSRRTSAGTSAQTPGRGGFEVPAADLERLTFSREEHLAIEAERLQICLRRHQARLAELASDAAQVLGRLEADVRRTGAELVVMFIPDEYQVNERLLREAAAALAVPLPALDVGAPQRHLGRLLAAAGIRYVDLLPAFRGAGRSEPLYYPRNTHWNDAGNALAARLLADYVVREGLATPRPAPARPGS